MSSASFQKWATERAASLDEIENAHVRVGGSERGRRYATQQINQAYVALLSSQFQGFCRDLHTESVDYLVGSILLVSFRDIVRADFVRDRRLDKGNPNPSNLALDFNRLGIAFWDGVKAEDQRNKKRQASLILLNDWRNAIAHQDFDPIKLGGLHAVRLQQVKIWRSACHGLAHSFDEVMRDHIQAVTGLSPW
jgi:hypothetical protein